MRGEEKVGITINCSFNMIRGLVRIRAVDPRMRSRLQAQPLEQVPGDLVCLPVRVVGQLFSEFGQSFRFRFLSFSSQELFSTGDLVSLQTQYVLA